MACLLVSEIAHHGICQLHSAMKTKPPKEGYEYTGWPQVCVPAARGKGIGM